MKNLLIIILVLLLLWILFGRENYSYPDMKKIKTDENILSVLRKMLKDVDNLFRKHNITYWASGGTLLGAIRHGDIIPWDDDADICVLKRDEVKMVKLKPLLNNLGYDITTFWGGYKIFPINGKKINYQNRNWNWSESSRDIEESENFNYKYPFIDVFIMTQDKNIYKPDNPKVIRNWKTEYYHIKNLLPLKKYKFNNFTIFGPGRPEEYLDRTYGSDWPYVGYRQYDHRNQMMIEKNKFYLQK